MNVEGHLTTPERSLAFGLERATYEVAPEAFRAIAHASESGERAVKKLLSGWYTLEPRPSPEDIIEMDLKQAESGRLAITLTIRRGQYFLAEILGQHKFVDFELVEEEQMFYIKCACHGQEWKLLKQSLPEYDYSWISRE